MPLPLKVFCWACASVIVGCALAATWWWIKIEIRLPALKEGQP
jgi:hypothetical protein